MSDEIKDIVNFIEFKACMYFFCIMFFYIVYEITQGSWQADIIVLAQMIIANYIMCYIQVYFLGNFDENEHFGIHQMSVVIICSTLYAGISYILFWFDKKIITTLLFFVYMVFIYVCLFVVYKMKRSIDTKELNKELKNFKLDLENRL